MFSIRIFDPSTPPEEYHVSFWDHLTRLYPELCTRERALDIAIIRDSATTTRSTYVEVRTALLAFISNSYEHLANHGYMALWIEPIFIDGRPVTWQLACDAMLYAEKHREIELPPSYFRSTETSEATCDYIPNVNESEAQFNIANMGFSYRDTVVCQPSTSSTAGTESVLLIFQKNHPDESLIPCPSCRSSNVSKNSYSTLGVRSWECQNLLCPGRSKYNRGKRYSFRALLMQEAIKDSQNDVSSDSVRAWARDLQVGRSLPEVVSMLIRHYSLHTDGVFLFGSGEDVPAHGRKLTCRPFPLEVPVRQIAWFDQSPWFARYIVDPSENSQADRPETTTLKNFTSVCGDSRYALRWYPDSYFDGAVTSPPYYNAREYSQWSNIYCYLHDMYRIARECFRVLKNGAPFLYNVFDYFDNERTIVYSAMGIKRLPLSAYTADVYRRAGFKMIGSVTWFKGDVEGKRAFNAGNFSPHYQKPFNCWEHIFVFAKPPCPGDSFLSVLPSVLRARPVVKLVAGRNVYGHSAPFPVAVPSLLSRLLPAGSRILDPFGGSGTTACALSEHHDKIVCVERNPSYCELALGRFNAYCEDNWARNQLSLL